MSKIISIGTAVPQYGTKQDVILEFMTAAYNEPVANRKLNSLFNYSVIPDFGRKNHFLFNGEPTIPNIEKRLTVFKELAMPLAIHSIKNALDKIPQIDITHLIVVTCTGLYSPGLDAEIIECLKLPSDIFHLVLNFGGCNAAFPAFKIADLITSNNANSKVLVVCTELCTLHFQPKNNHDNLLANTIFSDGSAAAVITSDSYAKQNHLPGLKSNGFYSMLLNQGKDLMGWNITPANFEMILDSRVPEFIGKEIEKIIKQTCRKLNFPYDSINKWAVHPGGKKILDLVKNSLLLDYDDLVHSYETLNKYGNMSSPTILFVLKSMLDSNLPMNESIFTIGFGPGLSFETALFIYE